MNSTVKKIICILLSAVMILALASCGKKAAEEVPADNQAKKPPVTQVSYDIPAENVQKNETVYVNMDPEGKVTGKVVTDWLHTGKAETYIDDITDLKDIQNVKSDIAPVMNKDGSLRWNMETTDLYYRGITENKLPVNFKIDYYLDGKQTSAEKIAGKSGQVKMVITMTNESFSEAEIGGKKTRIYTPFIVAGGMVLDENVFSNVMVENGKTIGDGTKEIALLVGTPGLKESLNLSDEILSQLGSFDFSSTYTITVDTEKFEISNMIFAVIPLSAVVTEISKKLPDTVSDVKSQLENIQTVIDKLNSMNAADLITGLFSNTDKLTELTASIGKVTKVYNENKPLLDVLEKYMTEENMNSIKQFIDDTEDVDLDEVVQLLSNPVLQRFFRQLPALANDMKTVMPIINGLSEDLSDPEVQKAVDKLPQTLATLKELKKTVDDNQELFDTLGEAFDEKTVASLKEVMDSLNGIMDEKTLSRYAGLIDNADDLIARAEKWVEAGQNYNLFTKAPKNVQTSVIFIYETSPVAAKAEKKEINRQEDALEENAIKTWFKKVFKIDN